MEKDVQKANIGGVCIGHSAKRMYAAKKDAQIELGGIGRSANDVVTRIVSCI